MKTKNDHKTILLAVFLILMIMALSFAFRYAVNHRVTTQLGEVYMDPETRVPYLTEMDSYYHLRMTRDLATYGHAGDTVKDGELWDSLSYAPDGRSAEGYRPLMSYIAIGSQKFLSLFSSVTLEQVAYWQGAILSALVVVPVFLFVLKLKGMLAACVASILAAINYGYFVHTVPGFFDTDMVISWTSAFVFCFGCFIVESLENDGTLDTKHLWRKRILYLVLFALSLYALFLSWYIYYMFAGILAAALFIYLLLRFLRRGETDKKEAFHRILPGLVFLIALSLIIPITNPDLFRSFFSNIKGVFSSGKTDLFPSALISVSEMRKPSLIAGGLTGLFQMRVLSESNIGIINAVGGMVPCLCALVMWVILIIRTIKKEIRFSNILLILWFLITAVLAVRSWRFIMLFALPVAILAGMFAGTICNLMREKKMMDYQIFAGMIVTLLLFPAVYGAYRSASDSTPTVNRTLHDTLTHIREETDENTIVAGWWDYGYFFEAKTQRRPLFDGGSQSGQRIFWVGRALATEDEDLSANIIRMLSGSGNAATDEMLATFGESRETLKLMDELLKTDAQSAKDRLLRENITAQEADRLSALLFPASKDPVIFVVTPDMPGISGWFAEFGFGSADEEKPYKILIDRMDASLREEKTAWQLNVDGREILFYLEAENGEYRAYTESPDGEEGQPYPVERILLIENGLIRELPVDAGTKDAKTGYTLIINKNDASSTLSLMSSDLTDSVFGRLFYLGGAGLTRYQYEESGGGSALYWTL